MTNIVQMKDSDGNPFYPKTHVTAVEGYETETLDPAVQQALDQKVDKVDGYGLSKNDYTDDDKAKVTDIGILTSPNGTSYKIIVNDDGTLGTEVISGV